MTTSPSTKMERFTFTVGKLDAGMAILIGERAHLIEFPSLLLPPGVTSGSIVNISVSRNVPAEKAQASEFWSLQDAILQEYGLDTPKAPELKLRHVTQTSVTLEWPSLQLAKAKLRSLEILKNGTRLATIPNPTANTSTKLSSLQMNEEYTFQLILKTTAGTYPSNVVRVRTHTLSDTSGISVCFGTVEDPQLLAQAKAALERMNAGWTEKIQIDTTQFVCTSPMAPGVEEHDGRGGGPTVEYQKAMQLSLPIVQPQWILACQGEKKLVPVSSYQLGSAPIQSFSTAPFSRSSIPGSPIRRSSMTTAAKAASIQRAPSPETIARMSINTSGATNATTAAQAGPSSASSATAAMEGPVTIEEQISRPKSPRPEAVGKLDRSFKFPTTSPPTESPVELQGARDHGAEAMTGEPATIGTETAAIAAEDVEAQSTAEPLESAPAIAVSTQEQAAKENPAGETTVVDELAQANTASPNNGAPGTTSQNIEDRATEPVTQGNDATQLADVEEVLPPAVESEDSNLEQVEQASKANPSEEGHTTSADVDDLLPPALDATEGLSVSQDSTSIPADDGETAQPQGKDGAASPPVDVEVPTTEDAAGNPEQNPSQEAEAAEGTPATVKATSSKKKKSKKSKGKKNGAETPLSSTPSTPHPQDAGDVSNDKALDASNKEHMADVSITPPVLSKDVE